jgi:hypothetical protein
VLLSFVGFVTLKDVGGIGSGREVIELKFAPPAGSPPVPAAP